LYLEFGFGDDGGISIVQGHASASISGTRGVNRTDVGYVDITGANPDDGEA
jgi:hypothetical protein